MSIFDDIHFLNESYYDDNYDMNSIESLIETHEINFNGMMNRIGLNESYIRPLSEGAIKDIFTKIINFIKDIWKRIKDFFKKLFRKHSIEDKKMESFLNQQVNMLPDSATSPGDNSSESSSNSNNNSNPVSTSSQNNTSSNSEKFKYGNLNRDDLIGKRRSMNINYNQNNQANSDAKILPVPKITNRELILKTLQAIESGKIKTDDDKTFKFYGGLLYNDEHNGKYSIRSMRLLDRPGASGPFNDLLLYTAYNIETDEEKYKQIQADILAYTIGNILAYTIGNNTLYTKTIKNLGSSWPKVSDFKEDIIVSLSGNQKAFEKHDVNNVEYYVKNYSQKIRELNKYIEDLEKESDKINSNLQQYTKSLQNRILNSEDKLSGRMARMYDPDGKGVTDAGKARMANLVNNFIKFIEEGNVQLIKYISSSITNCKKEYNHRIIPYVLSLGKKNINILESSNNFNTAGSIFENVQLV